MSLQKEVMDKMKEAMKAKDTVALQALRAVKSAFLLAKTATGVQTEITPEQEVKIIQKQVKQRKDSAAIFITQKRQDLADPELAEIAVLEQFLPAALSEEEIEKVVAETITKLGASGMKDMGKVMGVVSNALSGQADGKVISTLVKKLLKNQSPLKKLQKRTVRFAWQSIHLMLLLAQFVHSLSSDSFKVRFE